MIANTTRANNDEVLKSDLAKVDAYENTAADYEELPELDDTFFERAVIHKASVQVRSKLSEKNAKLQQML